MVYFSPSPNTWFIILEKFSFPTKLAMKITIYLEYYFYCEFLETNNFVRAYINIAKVSYFKLYIPVYSEFNILASITIAFVWIMEFLSKHNSQMLMNAWS